eukprot:TRINITY_DN2628_c0_g1_i2.p1 TRINITY_DN2628_c0_g1~~TRINITY_DN2628_c0_g1_i2.p1  ORF type:complete len:384 (-),score=57.76 TRINITY_DN2628_c0_g1_i2:39-1190(-)
MLNVSKEEEGNYIGNIVVFAETTSVIISFFWGTLSDKIGRKVVYILSFLIMSVSIAAMPYVQSIEIFILIRVVFAIGVSAASGCITSLLADYPAPEGRGRAGGIIGLTSGLGALLSLFIFLRIPLWFSHIESRITRGMIMFFTMAGFLFLSQIVLGFGLSKKRSTKESAKFTVIMKEGAKSILQPKILLSYLGSFAARGDSIIITTFIVLWVQQFELAQGVSLEEAVAKAGAISGIAQTFALVFAVPAGFLAERLDKVTFQTISAFVSLVGYCVLSLLDDPTGVFMYIGVSIVGIGEIMMIIANSVLLSNEAPPPIRGALAGFQVVLGSIAIIILTKLGGYLFDVWSPRAPFMLLVFVNCVIFIYGQIYIAHRHCTKKPTMVN